MNHPFLFYKKISQIKRALAYSYVIKGSALICLLAMNKNGKQKGQLDAPKGNRTVDKLAYS